MCFKATSHIEKIRLFVKVNRSSNCWEWQGKKNASGHGRVWWKGKNWIVHRLLFESVFGSLPYMTDVHHLCENPACLNPSHLVPLSRTHHLTVTRVFNGSRNASKRFCKNGHELTADNTYVYQQRKPHRTCRKCVLTSQHERYFRLRQIGPTP